MVAVPRRHGTTVVACGRIPVEPAAVLQLPLPFTTADLESWLRWAREHNPRHVREIEVVLAATGAAWPCRCAPRRDHRRAVAGPESARAARLQRGEKQVLRQCARSVRADDRKREADIAVVEQEKLRRDIALASEVQRRLLPEHPPRREGIGARRGEPSRPHHRRRLLRFPRARRPRIGIALADVAGKGVAAALIMSVVQASLRIISAEGDVAPGSRAQMNGSSTGRRRASNYATFFYAQLDERSRQLRYVNAGHNPPVSLAAGAGEPRRRGPQPEIRELSIGGTVVGMFPEMSTKKRLSICSPAMSSSPSPTASPRRTTPRTKSSARNA